MIFHDIPRFFNGGFHHVMLVSKVHLELVSWLSKGWSPMESPKSIEMSNPTQTVLNNNDGHDITR